jgi:hypothetical protein
VTVRQSELRPRCPQEGSRELRVSRTGQQKPWKSLELPFRDPIVVDGQPDLGDWVQLNISFRQRRQLRQPPCAGYRPETT